MAYHNQLGKQGEDLAAKYLTAKGYKILAKNWRYRHLEIDLIAVKDKQLVIVEVKTRTRNYQTINQLIPYSRQKRLTIAANQFIRQRDLDLEVRFDVLLIENKGTLRVVEHIEGAFVPPLIRDYWLNW